MGRLARDLLWVEPDEIPRHILVRLFEGSHIGGSTPLVPSSDSDEEPNTNDRKFLKGETEETSDPSYEPTDEKDEELTGEESNHEEDTKSKYPSGGE